MDIIFKNQDMICTYKSFVLRISDLNQNLQAAMSYWDLMKANVRLSIHNESKSVELFESQNLKVSLSEDLESNHSKKINFEVSTCGMVESFSIPRNLWDEIFSNVQKRYNTSLYTDQDNYSIALDKALELYKKQKASI